MDQQQRQMEAHRFARQLAGDGHAGLSTRLRHATGDPDPGDKQPEKTPPTIAPHGWTGRKSGGLAQRLRNASGAGPLGSVGVCRSHQWVHRGYPTARRECAVCGLGTDF